MKKEFTPDDLAHLKATYESHGGHLRWILRSVIIGAAVGIGLAAIVGHVGSSNPALWLGLAYGAALPGLDYAGQGSSIKGFVLAPVTYAKELAQRIKEIAAGRRALKERFADYY